MWRDDEYGGSPGKLCLRFANTNDWHASQHPVETLHEFADLVGWGRTVGLLSEGEADALTRAGQRRPEQAKAAIDRARELRESIYAVFSAVAAGRRVPGDDLARISAAALRPASGRQLTQVGEEFHWTWSADPADLDWVLWPAARSAADLLTSDQLARVGECADDRGCGWLFLDTSRNHSRRWCGMEACGNRAKARRHYQRRRGAAQPA